MNKQRPHGYWQNKFRKEQLPEVKILDKDIPWGKAGDKMLIPTPQLVDAYIRKIPKGTQVDIATMRQDLAKEYQVHFVCPLTSGIFLRIVSEKAYEDYIDTKSIEQVTPFWRVVKVPSPLSKKLSCGERFISDLQVQENS